MALSGMTVHICVVIANIKGVNIKALCHTNEQLSSGILISEGSFKGS